MSVKIMRVQSDSDFKVEKWLALKKCAAFKTGSDRGSFISDESHNVNEKCREELDLLQEHLTDSKLNLPMDPRLWTPCDVRNWLHHMTEIHNIQVDRSFFQMNGRGLCLMSLNGFLFRVPDQGKLLYEDFRERLKQCLLAPGCKAIKPTIQKLSSHDVERRSVLENGKMSPLVYHTL